MTICIRKSPTADSRTCDYKNVPLMQLIQSSRQHINDVQRGMGFFIEMMQLAAFNHDWDKIDLAEHFHSDFVGGFKEQGWFDNHKRIHRHHLNYEEGVPDDVNLVDLIEYITDCVMAGMARSGSVYAIEASPELLSKAFYNTVELLKSKVVVDE